MRKKHVLSPTITTNVGIRKPNVVATNLEISATIEAAYKHMSTIFALVIMDHFKPEAAYVIQYISIFKWIVS
jgi:hypothetical protein